MSTEDSGLPLQCEVPGQSGGHAHTDGVLVSASPQLGAPRGSAGEAEEVLPERLGSPVLSSGSPWHTTASLRWVCKLSSRSIFLNEIVSSLQQEQSLSPGNPPFQRDSRVLL